MSTIKIDDFNKRMRRAERNRRFMWALLTLVLGLPVAFGGWWVAKRINYSLQYKDMVRATVCEMVKPEALKE